MGQQQGGMRGGQQQGGAGAMGSMGGMGGQQQGGGGMGGVNRNMNNVPVNAVAYFSNSNLGGGSAANLPASSADKSPAVVPACTDPVSAATARCVDVAGTATLLSSRLCPQRVLVSTAAPSASDFVGGYYEPGYQTAVGGASECVVVVAVE
jgi:hypothetical protein